ncbi:DUF2294 domain-containing protein [Pleurocapsa sp. CCALA 161]|uniref:DUF2294 domain-containing protein n=1 Tax=Pleurocapsa sp. CCALA 161 TaxID=2107688 RepID=UPI0021016A80|nr:DUF2294 domain-containing protein [Pleurocapsa sp. CCALA 161]
MIKRNRLKINQIKSILSQKIEDIYQQQLEHKINNISYKLFDNILVIILEGIITSPEKLLKDHDHIYLAKQVRKAVDNIVHPQIKEIIEEVLDVKIIDFLSDTTIKSDLTGAIAIFEPKPKDN